MKGTSIALRAALVFVVFGLLWILTTDLAVSALAPDLERLAAFQFIKGVAFIVLAAALLYHFLSSRLWRRERQAEEEAQRSLELRAIAELGTRALSGEDLQAVFEAAAETCLELQPYEIACVFEAGGSSNPVELKPRAIIGISADELPAASLASMADPDLPSFAVNSAADGAQGPFIVFQSASVNFQSSLISEIELRDRRYGCLALFGREPLPAGQVQRSFLQGVAHALGLAVARQRAEDRLRGQANQQRALAELGAAALATTDLQRLLDRAAVTVTQQLQVEYAGVLEVDAEADWLRLVAGAGWDEDVIGSVALELDGGSMLSQALSQTEPILAEDHLKETRFRVPAYMRDHDVVSSMCIRVPGRDDPYGVLSVASSQTREFSDNDVVFLRSAANILGEAIQRLHSGRENRYQSQLLHSVGEAVIATDLEGRVRYWNPGAERIYGWGEQEALGAEITSLNVSNVDRARSEEIIRTVASGDSWTGEFPVHNKQGETFPAQVTNAPIFDQQGQMIGIVGVSRDLRELRGVEAALAESEALHQLVLANIQDAVFITDETGDFRYVCSNAQFTFAYDQHEVEALGNIRALFDGELLVSEAELDQQGTVANIEVRVQDKEAEWHDLLVSVRRVSILDGTRLYACREVTERVAAERALAESEARYRSMSEDVLDSSSVGTFILDADMKVRWLNQAAERYFEVERSELLGADYISFLREHVLPRLEAPDVYREHLETAYRNNQRDAYELHVLAANGGQERWLQGNGQPIEQGYYAGGRLEHYTDVTQRKRLERELEEALERLRLVTMTTQAALWDYHVEDGWTWRSPAYATAFGYPPESIDSSFEYWQQRIHPQDRERVLNSLQSWLESGEETWIVEYRFRRGDGSYAWVYDRGFALFDEKGETARVMGSMLDISERKAAEQSLRQQGRRLQIMRELDGRLLSTSSAHEMAQAALDSLQKLIGFDCALAATIDGAKQEGEIVAAFGDCGAEIEQGVRFKIEGSGLSTADFEREQSVQFGTSEDDLPLGWFGQQARSAGIETVQSVRLLAQGEIVGVLALGRRSLEQFAEADRATLTEVGDGLAMGIRGAMLLTREQRRAAEQESLRRASMQVSSELQLEPVLDTVAEEAMRLLPGMDCNIFLYENGELTFGAARYRNGRSHEPFADPRKDGLTYNVARSGERIVVEDSSSHPLYADAFEDWRGAIAGIPLLAHNQVVGVMNLAFEHHHRFTEPELSTMEQLGDIAAIAISNARLYRSQERQRAELSALLDVATNLALQVELDAVLQSIVNSLRSTIQAGQAATIFIHDETQQALVARAWDGHEDAEMRDLTFPLGTSVAGQAFQLGKARVFEHVQELDSFVELGSRKLDSIRSLLAAPILAGDQLLGMMFVDNFESPTAFDEQDLGLAQAMAAHASAAISRAQLFERVEESRRRLAEMSRQLVETQEAERRHLARELHDEVGQILTSLKLTLEMIEGEAAQDPAIGRAIEMTADLLSRVRDLALDLRPAMLDDLGLLPAVEWLVERFGVQSSLAVSLERNGEPRRAAQAIETAAYRVVQEALTNVVRHAQTQEASVAIWFSDGGLKIQVEDKGRGFDPEFALGSADHSGVSGMRERVALVGGQFEVQSEPGAGTRVEAQFPVTELEAGGVSSL